MNSHVAVKLSAVLEGTSAYIALSESGRKKKSVKWLKRYLSDHRYHLVGTLLRVDSPVHLKVLLNAKHLVAKLTFEGTLAGVGSIVTNLMEEEEKFIHECVSISPQHMRLVEEKTRTAQMFSLRC